MGWLADGWAGLVDLVLPANCAGCDATAARRGLCSACEVAFALAIPRRVRPQPAPAGLPRCYALAAYDGALRHALLAYKEQGRHALAAVLGDALAGVVRAALPAPCPVLLLPVPATGAAARRRYGDHVARLARRAASTLRTAGWPAGVAQPVRALPRPDSVHLSGTDRAIVAAQAFEVRAERVPVLRRAVSAGAVPVLIDDIVTTGATLSAIARRLSVAGVEVAVAGVLAATRRRNVTGRAPAGSP